MSLEAAAFYYSQKSQKIIIKRIITENNIRSLYIINIHILHVLAEFIQFNNQTII